MHINQILYQYDNTRQPELEQSISILLEPNIINIPYSLLSILYLDRSILNLVQDLRNYVLGTILSFYLVWVLHYSSTEQEV